MRTDLESSCAPGRVSVFGSTKKQREGTRSTIWILMPIFMGRHEFEFSCSSMQAEDILDRETGLDHARHRIKQTFSN